MADPGSLVLQTRRPHIALTLPAVLCLLFVCCAILSWSVRDAPPLRSGLCPQQAKIVPRYGNLEDSSQFYSPGYEKRSAAYLSGAVQIPTVSYDDMGPPDVDPRFRVFAKFHHYLKSQFPLTAHHVETVNEYALLYTFEGSNSSVKPIVLMAHQDVVPIDPATLDQWTYPPFAGHFDGEFVYGRGSSDCKNNLVGILEAVESLLRQNWTPTRTIILSFGYDEEISGHRGAGELAHVIESRYGRLQIEGIIDEGVGILSQGPDMLLAIPINSEKGMADFELTLNTDGGHSSKPPDHTNIGIMASLVNLLEAHPYRAHLADKDPALEMFQCVAEHSTTMDRSLKEIILDVDRGDNRKRLVQYIQSLPAEYRYLIKTSQAIDLVRSGTKINALPETATLGLNYRIAIDSSVKDVRDVLTSFTKQVATKHDIGLIVNSEEVLTGSKGSFTLTDTGTREPSPISPRSGPLWDLMAGTSRHIFEDVSPRSDSSTAVVVSPGTVVGNTDTFYYWNLTESIYRYSPVRESDTINLHTVDEKMRLAGHLDLVAWYYEFLINSSA